MTRWSSDVLDKYVLDADGQPQRCDEINVWEEWFRTANRTVQVTPIGDPPQLYVSTVFLGRDHNFQAAGPPVLWETMTFAAHPDGVDVGAEGEDCQLQERYTSRAAALAGHARLVRRLKQKDRYRGGEAPPP